MSDPYGKPITSCRHEAASALEGFTLPEHLNPRPDRDVAAECVHCTVVFMAVRCDGDLPYPYRDYRDVDYGGRRP